MQGNQTRRPAALAAASGTQILIGLIAVSIALIVGVSVTSGALRTWLEVITLGVVEGVTEFLPISSTGHLLLVSRLLGFQNSIGGTFEIFIQLGAIVAVIVYYANDLFAQVRSVATSKQTQRFWLALLVAFLPAALVGIALRKQIKAVLFGSVPVIAASLIIGGVILIVVERWLRTRPTAVALEQVTLRQALGIGVAQVFSLVPGVSRSASTIVGGMLGGLDRTTATAFSFYLSIPVLGAATLLDLVQSLKEINSGDIARLAVGTLVSFVVAYLSIGWLLRFVSRNSFVGFGIYRIIAGLAVLALFFAGRI